MSTLIDSLIVSLDLDPSGFNQQQQKALQDLRKFKSTAGTTAQESTRDLGRSIQTFFSALRNPLKMAEEGLSQLASQSRRTGDSLGAGMGQGVSALNAMAASGLIALGVLKSIQALMGDIKNTQQAAFTTGYMAQWAGVTTPWMSALAQAAFVKRNVPQQQTESWLFGLQRSLETFVAPGPGQGQITPQIETFLRLGINPLQYSSNGVANVPAILAALENRLAAMPAPEQQAVGAQLGLPPGLISFLAMGSAAVAAATATENLTAETEAQFQAATKLTQEENQLAVDFQHLSLIILQHVAPALEAFLGWLDKFLRRFSHQSTAARTGEGAAAGALAGAATGAAIGTIIPGIGTAAGALAGAAIGAIAGGGAGYEGGSDEPSSPSLPSSSPPPLQVPSSVNQISTARSIQQQLSKAGYSPIAIASVLGNAMAESSFNPGASGPGGAFGLLQWDPERQAQYAQIFGHTMQQEWQANPKQALKEQLQFMELELNTTFSGVGQELRTAPNAAIGAQEFSLYYEKNAGGVMEAWRRGELAQSIYAQGNYATTPAPATTAPTASAAPGPDANTPYSADLLKHIQALNSHVTVLRQPVSTVTTTTHNKGDTSINNNVTVRVPPGADASLIGHMTANAIANKLITTQFNEGFE